MVYQTGLARQDASIRSRLSAAPTRAGEAGGGPGGEESEACILIDSLRTRAESGARIEVQTAFAILTNASPRG